MNKVFIIKKTFVDWMENNLDAALYEKIVGFVTTQEEAESITNSEFIIGTGWPICKDKQVPLYSYEIVEPYSNGGEGR